ncbi:hypothetical protein [Pseudobacteroides cellulosolvens]|uniref:Uncharacterized protein n=1 Tax=Pseudobacteroides cellulosolvens ATCC 35603 = DSM 2933 TaxID=398512 RepID=A0A0L6JGY1_9FIRM|nr:hypothetical protein [Pseudobacteroides cellulosolvens]KNY24983.1 hypothetical protein Bccel_0240 [Pseudobacteroides cellulosolvens ATCC 35603 = DSM 2933]
MDTNMELFAKPNNKVIVVSSKFIEDRKKNKIDPEFLAQCLKYKDMLNKTKGDNK